MIESVDELRNQLEAVMLAATAGKPALPAYHDGSDQPDLVLVEPSRTR